MSPVLHATVGDDHIFHCCLTAKTGVTKALHALQAAAAEANVRDERMQAELREIGQVSPLLPEYVQKGLRVWGFGCINDMFRQGTCPNRRAAAALALGLHDIVSNVPAGSKSCTASLGHVGTCLHHADEVLPRRRSPAPPSHRACNVMSREPDADWRPAMACPQKAYNRMCMSQTPTGVAMHARRKPAVGW